jgi:hypothetical protein
MERDLCAMEWSIWGPIEEALGSERESENWFRRRGGECANLRFQGNNDPGLNP